MLRASRPASVWAPVRVALLFAGCYGATACVGDIGDGRIGPPPVDSATTCEVDFEPAPLALKRLNRREYANTVRDLLHLPSVDLSAFPPDGANGFDTDPPDCS